MTSKRLTPLALAVAIGVMVSALRISGCRPLDVLDLRALDARLQQRGVKSPAPEVVVVAVDDASVATVGRWPWSRPLMARLLDTISAAGPAVIGLDLVQSEATTACTLDGLDGRLDDSCRAAVRDAVHAAQGDDPQFATAVRDSQRAVLGYFFDFEGRGPPAQPTTESAYALIQRTSTSRTESVPHATALTQNLPEIAAAARGLGYFNFFPDADGLYRHAPLAIRFGDRFVLPLSLAMLHTYWPDRPLAIRFGPFGVDSVRIGAIAVPVDDDGQMLVNYRGPGRTVPHVSAADVLAG